MILAPSQQLCQVQSMGWTCHFWVGLAAGLLSFLAYVPYIIATLKGKNQPNQATWTIWFMVSLILLTSYKTLGATHAIWLSMANTVGMGAIVILSFKYGNSGLTKLDLGCCLSALVGIFFWAYFDSPIAALSISLAIDAVGAIPTLRKAYTHPESEDHKTWLIFLLANTLNLFALEEWRPALSLYPLYLFLISGAMALMLTMKKSFSDLV